MLRLVTMAMLESGIGVRSYVGSSTRRDSGRGGHCGGTPCASTSARNMSYHEGRESAAWNRTRLALSRLGGYEREDIEKLDFLAGGRTR